MPPWSEVRLTPPQRELLDALARGVRVRWVEPYVQRGFYRRWDTGRDCTAAALALLAKGVVERCNRRGAPVSGKHDLQVVGDPGLGAAHPGQPARPSLQGPMETALRELRQTLPRPPGKKGRR